MMFISRFQCRSRGYGTVQGDRQVEPAAKAFA
jgi:hypothetical protein